MAKYLIRKTAALIAAFSLPVSLAVIPTIDRNDEHLNERVQLQMQHKNEASQQYVNAAYEAMWAERNKGNYMEVLEP